MRRLAPVLAVLAVILSALPPSASAGDCNRGRGRIVHRRSHAPAANTQSWNGRKPSGSGYVESGHAGVVVHSSPTPVVSEHVTESASSIVHSAPSVAVHAPASSVASAPVSKSTPLADIVDTAVAAGSFKTLAAALGAADLVGTLKGNGPFTVFAPTDDAFAKLPAGTVEELLKPENKDKLRDILLLHVVPGKVAAADVVKLSEAKTAGGGTLSISATDGVKVGTASGSATVVKTDIPAKNGLIHVIDSVLLP